MKFADITHKELEELKTMLNEKRISLAKLSFNRSQQTLKDFSQISKTKHEIAQILTVINKSQYNNKSSA